MESPLSHIFNEEAINDLKATAQVLGLPSEMEAFAHAFHLLDLAKKAKEQGKTLAVVGVRKTEKEIKIAVDALVTPLESRTGNIKVEYMPGSNFKLNP
jgi:hypothetical protein